MLTFTRTTDSAAIKRIVTHPAVWPHVHDDGAPDAAAWEPVLHERIWYVLVHDDQELLGLWMLVPRNAATYEVHTCLLPNARGARAIRAGKAFLTWMWQQLPCYRLVTEVPQFNRAAGWYARQAGMTAYGCNPKAYMKDGQLHDILELGISRPEAIPCP